MGRIAGRGGLPGTYPPDGPVIQTDRLCAAGTGQQGKTAARRPPSRRTRFSAATRTYLASVPDSPGYWAIRSHSSADEREAHVREVERSGQHLPEAPTAAATARPSPPARPGSPPACAPSSRPTARPSTAAPQTGPGAHSDTPFP